MWPWPLGCGPVATHINLYRRYTVRLKEQHSFKRGNWHLSETSSFVSKSSGVYFWKLRKYRKGGKRRQKWGKYFSKILKRDFEPVFSPLNHRKTKVCSHLFLEAQQRTFFEELINFLWGPYTSPSHKCRLCHFVPTHPACTLFWIIDYIVWANFFLFFPLFFLGRPIGIWSSWARGLRAEPQFWPTPQQRLHQIL